MDDLIRVKDVPAEKLPWSFCNDGISTWTAQKTVQLNVCGVRKTGIAWYAIVTYLDNTGRVRGPEAFKMYRALNDKGGFFVTLPCICGKAQQNVWLTNGVL